MQDRAGNSMEACPGGGELPAWDEAPPGDQGAAQEASPRLGRGPVPAGGLQRAADQPPQVAENLARAHLQRPVGKLAAGQLAIDLYVHAIDHGARHVGGRPSMRATLNRDHRLATGLPGIVGN